MTHPQPFPAVPARRIQMLGAFRIEVDGQTIHLPTRKVELLFAYLALFPQPCPREKLAALFWGDVSDEQARLSFRVALSALRKSLGDAIIVAERDALQLNPHASMWIDVEVFQRAAIDQPELASEVYGGELLPGMYEDWILRERERLQILYQETLLRLAQRARSQSQYARVVELARRVLQIDSTNEKAHQHLIFAYLMLGNRPAALQQYADCVRLLRAELNADPAPETTELFARAQAGETGAKSAAALFANLPTPFTSFIGRAPEIAQVKRALATTRLLTLIGAGGCGKTRLAIQVATELAAANHYRDGVWWVELAALADAMLVTQAVALTFNVSESPAIPLIAVLTNHLRAKALLLVLDNCEHLLGACAQLASRLLSACPQLQILITSREPLNVSGEIAWRVPSLALPAVAGLPALAQLRQSDAIQLFNERALAANPTWRLADAPMTVCQVCARLDGIPLAIELAAAQLKHLTVQDLAARLDDRFNLLAGNRAELPRHQTLRATMDWSFDLLSEPERELLRRLSVFAGGFTLKAVESVCRIQNPVFSQPNIGYSTLHTLDLLTLLVDKSLVVVETDGSTTRYRLLETVRQYAHEKLAADANAIADARTRHRDYFVDWIETAAPHLRRADAIDWRDRIELDYDNLRAAWEHAIESDAHLALRIAWGLKQYWSWRGLVPEGLAWVKRLLPISETWGATGARARVLTLHAFLYRTQWNIPTALQSVTQAVEIARTANAPRDLGYALQEAAYLHQFPIPPNCALAIEYFDESRKIFETLGDDTMREWTDMMQAMAIAGTGDVARGMALMQASLERCRATGDKLGMFDALGGQGYISLIIGDYPNAAKYNGEVVKLGRELRITIEFVQMLTLYAACIIKLGDYRAGLPRAEEVMCLYHDQASIPGIVIGLEMIGMCLAASKKFAAAVRLLGNVEREREAKRSTTFVVPDFFAPEWANARAQMGDAAYAQANAAGRAMELEQAYEFALEQIKTIM